MRRQQINEWFAARGDETLRLDYPLGPTSLVWDVGAYVGDWSRKIWERYGCSIEMFEPMPRFWPKAEEQVRDGVVLHKFGLSDKTETTSMEDMVDGSRVTSSGSVSVHLRSVTEQLEAQPRQIDLMKVNIEGGEYPLIGSMCDTGLIRKVTDLQVQFHNFVPDADRLLDIMREKLSATHEMTWCYDFVWENWRLKK